ncbi:CoxG family protein [Thermogemmatispora sp.]|uniref:CoxG family protein n=1 Tax=Thermogemmatispora sp. TaxID=1968838 RepID=UPI001D2444A1|nr:carbon monoxide dehydrogenase subunit G [Thermogemmatispora sp.]MBX5450532.1 carbon monoxide dehydrogenase subunit G [Thermogemmatispora sp.]
MKLNGTVNVSAPRERVWQIFMDPLQLCRVVPGCEEAQRVDDRHYEALLAVKIQFMTIRARAHGTLLEAHEPDHLVAEMVGEPLAMAGAFRARLVIDLVPKAGETEVRYAIDLSMLGRLASLGEAIIRATANRLASQFATNVAQLFSTQAQQPHQS